MQEYNELWDRYSKNWDLLKAPMRPKIGRAHV